MIVGDVTLCGFDNGKVAAVNLADGSLAWEATVAPSHGRTELERLVDIDSAVHVVGSDVYVVGFQGRVAMLALDSGQVWWSRDASSYRGLGWMTTRFTFRRLRAKSSRFGVAPALSCGARTLAASRPVRSRG